MSTARPFRLAAALILLAGLSAPLRAGPAKVTWDPARATSPDTVEELRALQDAEKAVVEKVTPSVVALLVGSGAGSGVIVRDDGLVLTAAHVIGEPGTPLKIVLTDGTVVDGKALGLNARKDSGMVQITGKPPKTATWPGAKDGKWPAAPVGKAGDVRVGQWLVALGHPGGPKKDRRPPVRLGRLEEYRTAEATVRTDCTLVGGDSGGPLFDLSGNVVGIHSRIGLFLDSNMHVPAEAYNAEWDQLARGDVVGASRAELGIVFADGVEEAKIESVAKNGPAEKGGLKAGDVVTKFKGEAVHVADDMIQLVADSRPGETVKVEVLRDGKTVELKVTLGRKRRG